jgi:hypothetical protein
MISFPKGLSDLEKGTHLQEYRVRSTHKHPQYKRGTPYNLDYNIGLLELEEAISFGPFVRPICLPPPGKGQLSNAHTLDPGMEGRDERWLREYRVLLITNSVCLKYYFRIFVNNENI